MLMKEGTGLLVWFSKKVVQSMLALSFLLFAILQKINSTNKAIKIGDFAQLLMLK
jgi:hypothetical protein